MLYVFKIALAASVLHVLNVTKSYTTYSQSFPVTASLARILFLRKADELWAGLERARLGEAGLYRVGLGEAGLGEAGLYRVGLGEAGTFG